MFRYLRLAWRIVQAFNADNCTFLAAGLCYYVFFSIFPLMLVMVGIAGHFLSAEQALAQAMTLVRQVFPHNAAQIGEVLQGVVEHRGGASLFGVAILLWSAKNIFGALAQALNRIWRIPSDRGWLMENLIAMGLTLSVGLLILAFGVVIAVITAIVNFRVPFLGWSPSQLPGTVFVMANLLPFCGVILIIMGLYLILPNRRLSWRQVLPGALVASCAWEVWRRLFGFYLEHMAKYDMVYGSLSGLVGFLFWIYVSALLFLFGAEVARVTHEEREGSLMGAGY